MKNWNEISRVTFWIVIVIGGIWLITIILNDLNKNKEEALDQHLERVCGVITNEQPDNINLYDRCMNTGYEEFAPSTD